MWKRGGKRFLSRIFGGSSKGATLIEVVIAIVVLAFLTAAVFPALLVLADAESKWNEQTIAESMARTTLEIVKARSYIAGNDTAPYPVYIEEEEVQNLIPNGTYDIEVAARPVYVDPDSQPPQHYYLDPGEDEGIQEVTVDIYHYVGRHYIDQEDRYRPVITVKNYKVDR